MSSQDDWLVDPKSNRFIDTYMRGYLDMSGGNFTLRNNNIHVNDGDISLNGRLFVNSDASLNSKLFVSNDVCMNQILMVGNDVSLNSKLFVANDVCMNELLMVGNDVSLNSKLFVAGDVCMNETLHVGNNVTFDSKLLVEGDSSFNSNVDISGDLIVRGTLGVYQRQDVKVINTTVNNYQLIITEDISLNGNLYVKDDVSLNSKLFVNEDVCFNEVLMVGNDVSFNSDLFVGGDLSLNGDLSVGMNTRLNNLDVRSWAVLRSTLDVSKNVTFGSTLDVSGATNVRSTLDVSGVTNLASTLKVSKAATLSSTLAVTGASTIGSTLKVNDTLTVSKASTLSSTLDVFNASTLKSTLNVSKAATLSSTLAVTGASTIGSTLKVNDTLTVSKASTLSSTLNVAKASTLKSTLKVSKAATLGSTLSVTGASTIGSTLKVNDTLTVSKASTLSSTLNVANASTLKSTLKVSKAATFGSTLYVARDVSMDTVVTIGGDVSLNNKMYVAGDVSMDTVVTIGGDVTMNSKLTVHDDVTLENGGITTNDISFNVGNLPFYATGEFTDNQKIIYSEFSNSDRVLNGLYDISASSVNGENHPWNVATNSTGTEWKSADGTGTNSTTIVTYKDNDANTSVNGEYIQFTFPFHIKLNQYVINTDNSVKDVRLIGFKDNNFYHMNTFTDGTEGGTGTSDTIPIDTSFYSNRFRIVFPNNGNNTSSITVISLSFNGDVIGSKVNIDNGNIGIGNVNPRSALEITGNMVLSNATSGINNSGENQEHGRITWAGIGRDISENPSSYIRSYFENETYDTSGNLAFGTSDGTTMTNDRFVIHSTGKNEFITDVSMDSNLEVNGDVSLNSNLYISGSSTMGSTLNVNDTLTVSKASTLNSTLNVSNAATLKSTLKVSNATTLSSTLDVTGLATMGSTLNVNDSLTVSKASTLSSTLNVANASTLKSTLNVSKATTLNSTLDVTGVATMGSTLKVNDSLTVSKASTLSSTLNVSKAATFSSTLNVVGESTMNMLTVSNASISSSLEVIGDVSINSLSASSKMTTTDLSINNNLVIHNNAVIGHADISNNNVLTVIGKVVATDFIIQSGEGDAIQLITSKVGTVQLGSSTVSPPKITTDTNTDTTIVIQTGNSDRFTIDKDGNTTLYNDVSMNTGLEVGGDVSLNSKLYVVNDVSMNAGLVVGGDVSMNSNVTVSGDLQIYGKLDVNQIQNTNTMNTTVNEYTLVVTEDLSINGGLSVSEDLSLNGNANISNKIIVDKDGDVTITNKNIVIGDSIYLSSIVGGGVFDNITQGLDNYTASFANYTYTISSSSYNSSSNFFAVASAFVNNNSTWKSDIDTFDGNGDATTTNNTTYISNNQLLSVNGEYIELTLPYSTTIDSYQIHTDTYQVPITGYLLGEKINSNGSSEWHFISGYNNIQIAASIRDTRFDINVNSGNQFETTKIRFVITRVNTDTYTTLNVTDSFGNQIDIYNKNVSVRYINFSGLAKNEGVSVGAGYSQNTANTSMGFATLAKNITGKNNIALGNYALSQTTSNDNVAVGYNSLIANTDGSSNIGIGSNALLNSSRGSNNTALGTNSGSSNDAGTNNTFIGNNAGYSNRYGDNNTFLGYNTDISGNHSHSTAIGADAKVTGDNQIVIGTIDDNVKIPGTIEFSGTLSGDVSFNDNIKVSGSTLLKSTLNVTNATTLNNTLNVVGKSTLTTLDVNSVSNFNNKLTVTAGGIQTNSINVTGTTSLNNTLSVTNATTFNNTLSVTGATTFNNTLSATGATTLKSRLDVAGDVSFNQKATINNLNVTGNTFTNTLTTSGASTINGNLTVAPNKDINLVDKFTINNASDITTITDATIKILNSGTDFIRIENNKIYITGATNNTEVMDVTGSITANAVTLKAGGTVTTTGDAATASTSTIVGDTSNGMGIYPLDGDGTVVDPYTGIRFVPFINKVNTNNNVFTIDNSGNTNIAGDLTIDNSLNVTGTSNLTDLKTTGGTSLNNLQVINATTLDSTLNVNNATTIASSLNVTGTTTLSDVTVTDVTTLSSTLNVSNATTLSSTLNVIGSSIFNDTLTVSKETSLNLGVDISGNVSVSHGPFTVNDVSFGVTNLPTSITGLFTSNPKILYSQYSGSERVFNGLYDVSASSVQDDNYPWHVFDESTSNTSWKSKDDSNTSSGSRVSYVKDTDIVDVSCEYIQITFPFYIQLDEYIINTNGTVNDLRVIGLKDDTFYHINEITSTINGSDTTVNNSNSTFYGFNSPFYSNTFQFLVPENSIAIGVSSFQVTGLKVSGDILGSKVHIDNGNLGIGTIDPRSALEVTGDMVISKPINGENTSGDSVEHGRIVWAGIGRDISNSNHSSYIRSYFEDGTYDTSGNLAFGTSDGTTVANDRFVINANGINNFITDVSMDSNLAVNGDVSFNTNLYVKEKVWIDGTVGVGTASPVVVFDINDTGALRIPVGQDNQRPVDTIDNSSFYGSIRYNNGRNIFEGYGPGGTWSTLNGVSNSSTVTRIESDVSNELIFYTGIDATTADTAQSLERMVITNDADISMNTSLHVANDVTFNSTLYVNNASTMGNTLKVNDTLTVSKASTLSSTLDVTGASTLKSTLYVSKAATLSSTLYVTGASTMGSTLKVNDTFTVSKASTLSSTLDVSKAATLKSTLKVSKAVTLSSTLDVTGKTTFKNDISLNGNLTMAGDLSLNGNLSVIQQNNQTILNTTVNDYTLIVSEDISLNGELKVSGDVSLNGELYVKNATTLDATLNVNGETTFQYDNTTQSPLTINVSFDKVIDVSYNGTNYAPLNVAYSGDGTKLIYSNPSYSGTTGVVQFHDTTNVEDSISTTPYGRDIAISSDGSTVIVGDSSYSSNKGVIWVYKDNEFKSGITGTQDYGYFGNAISITSDGAYCAIGAGGGGGSSEVVSAGKVYVYAIPTDGSLNAPIATLTSPQDNYTDWDHFGYDGLSIISDSTYIYVSGGSINYEPDSAGNINANYGIVITTKIDKSTYATTQVGANITNTTTAYKEGHIISLVFRDDNTLRLATYGQLQTYVGVYDISKDASNTAPWTLVDNTFYIGGVRNMSLNRGTSDVSGGDTLVIATTNAAYIYDYSQANIDYFSGKSEQITPITLTTFNSSISITDDGSKVAVGHSTAPFLHLLTIDNSNNTVDTLITAGTSGVLIKKMVNTNDYTLKGQHNMQLRIQNGMGLYDSRTLELGLLDNGTGIIQANESNVGSNNLALNPVSGNVGIGTETPSAKLHIHQPLLNSGLYPAGEINFSTDNGGDNWQLASIESYVKANNGSVTGYPGGLVFKTKAPDGGTSSLPVERMVINSNGNVGIGTTNPVVPLEIHNTDEPIRGRWYGNVNTYNSEFILNDLSYNSSETGQLPVNAFFCSNNNYGNTGLENSTNKQPNSSTTYDIAGAIGFGTCAPYFGSYGQYAAIRGLRLGLWDGGLSFATMGPTDGALSEKMRIIDNGNVGIGTTAPQGPLHVHVDNASGGIGGSLVFSRVTDGTNFRGSAIRNEFFSATTKESLCFNAIGSGNPNPLTLTPQMVLTHDGNVGIGTTSPANRLTVRAGANYDGILLQNTNDKPTIKLAQNSNEGYMNFYSNATATSTVKISINSNERTYFNNGNFGIGTSTPAQKLDVVGDITFGPSDKKWRLNAATELYFLYNGTAKGGFNPAGAFTWINFTGQHRCIVENNTIDNVGLIVCANKNKYISISESESDYKLLKGNRAIQQNESLPLVSLSSKSKDKSCFGVVSEHEDKGTNSRKFSVGMFESYYKKEVGDDRVFINSLGEGAIWVSNKNGVLESGDYITTSSIPGYGEKQDSEFLANYTVAKITMDCDFNPQLQPRENIQIVTSLDASGNSITNNVLNANGELQWIDELDSNGNIIQEYKYNLRYLDSQGNKMTKSEYDTKIANNEEVYIAAFVGCTYHCG